MSDETRQYSGNVSLADDTLYGADEIAIFLYGEDTGPNRRRVYHRYKSSNIPIAKETGTYQLRKSVYFAWLERLESREVPANDNRKPVLKRRAG